VAPVNEPGNIGLGTSVVISPAELGELTKILGKRLSEDEIDAKIVLPELVLPEMVLAYTSALLADEEVKGYVAAVTFHQYGEENKGGDGFAWDELGSLSKENGLPLWQTETVTQAEVRGQADESTMALETAINIHAALVGGNASAWLYWLYFGTDDKAGLAIIKGGEYKLLKQYWALWQYSHFISPGSVRINANTTDSDLLVSAYRRPDDLIAVVIINSADSAKTIKMPIAVKSAEMYSTSATKDGWRNDVDIEPADTGSGCIGMSLESQSINTILVQPKTFS